MVHYDENPAAKVRKRRREVMMDRSAKEKPTAEESFLIVMTVNTVQSDTIPWLRRTLDTIFSLRQ